MARSDRWKLNLTFARSTGGVIVGFAVAGGIDWPQHLEALAVMLLPATSIAVHGLAGAYFGGWIDRLLAARRE